MGDHEDKADEDTPGTDSPSTDASDSDTPGTEGSSGEVHSDDSPVEDVMSSDPPSSTPVTLETNNLDTDTKQDTKATEIESPSGQALDPLKTPTPESLNVHTQTDNTASTDSSSSSTAVLPYTPSLPGARKTTYTTSSKHSKYQPQPRTPLIDNPAPYIRGMVSDQRMMVEQLGWVKRQLEREERQRTATTTDSGVLTASSTGTLKERRLN